MKCLIPVFAVTVISVGLFSVGGCASSADGQRLGHDQQFGVGEGEFGTTSAIAGDYPSDLHRDHATTADSAHNR